MFRLLISLGAMFAVVMLVVAGIGYMISESALDIDKAKNRAKAALWGLLLLSMSWLILYTINLNLLKFNLLNQDINQVSGSSVPTPQPAAATPSNAANYNNVANSCPPGLKFSPSPEGGIGTCSTLTQ